jgi:phosphoribosylanthranilate isomerase
MLVKICGITNLADALESLDAGADALGFNFYGRSPRYIAPDDASRIVKRLPAGVLTVGVFVNEEFPETVAGLADRAGVGAVQLHGDETPEYCYALKDRYVIKALRVDPDYSPSVATRYGTNAILLDAHTSGARGGTGMLVDWELARQTRELGQKLFLAGGLSPENVAAAIAAVQPHAVDACSRLEHAPGRKDGGRVRAFIAAVRGAC